LLARFGSGTVGPIAEGGQLTEERKDYAILISLATREEADVAASALRADGIEAFLGNVHHATAQWGSVQALGGIQIMVPFNRLGDAKELLRGRLKEWSEEADEEPAPRRDRWKAWVLLAFLLGPLLAALAYSLVNGTVERVQELL
jgi:hypothetical protein